MPDREKQYTLLDIGCGVGDYYGYLLKNGFQNIQYLGLDILPEMVTAARQKYPQGSFQTADFASRGWQSGADFIVCSGALNMVFGDRITHENFIKQFVCKMYQKANLAAAFNLLSQKGQAEFVEDERFYYADPLFWQDFCCQITPGTHLAEDYLTHDFTIFMAKPKTTEKIPETK